jgi:hypothetical protein
MAQPRACLTPEELRQLALGLLPEPLDEDCAAHVQQCPTCETNLRGLAVRDPLLDAIARRGSGEAAAHTPPDQPLLARLRPPPVPGPTQETSPPEPGRSLPADEREACRQVWAEVEALLKKAQAAKTK